jgi:anti-sigma B factor antagonist
VTVGSALRIDESRTGGVCVVALGGRIDSTNAEQLMARLKDLLASGENAILVDLSGVIYLTSAAFRALLVATREAERNKARFVLCSVLGQVRELFAMGQLLEAFTIHGSREEALAQLA